MRRRRLTPVSDTSDLADKSTQIFLEGILTNAE